MYLTGEHMLAYKVAAQGGNPKGSSLPPATGLARHRTVADGRPVQATSSRPGAASKKKGVPDCWAGHWMSGVGCVIAARIMGRPEVEVPT